MKRGLSQSFQNNYLWQQLQPMPPVLTMQTGTVKTIKNSFYFITFDPTQKGKQDASIGSTRIVKVRGEPRLHQAPTALKKVG